MKNFTLLQSFEAALAFLYNQQGYQIIRHFWWFYIRRPACNGFSSHQNYLRPQNCIMLKGKNNWTHTSPLNPLWICQLQHYSLNTIHNIPRSKHNLLANWKYCSWKCIPFDIPKHFPHSINTFESCQNTLNFWKGLKRPYVTPEMFWDIKNSLKYLRNISGPYYGIIWPYKGVMCQKQL